MNLIRIGQGYDVHQLVADRPLLLGGVNIRFPVRIPVLFQRPDASVHLVLP